jgi:hypothetical protein
MIIVAHFGELFAIIDFGQNKTLLYINRAAWRTTFLMLLICSSKFISAVIGLIFVCLPFLGTEQRLQLGFPNEAGMSVLCTVQK